VLQLDYNAAALLAYVPFIFINVIFSVIWLKTEPDNEFLRFSSAQSLVLTGAFAIAGLLVTVFSAIIGMIPIVNMIIPLVYCVWFVVVGAYVVLSVLGMTSSYSGNTYRMPFFADFTDKLIS